MPEITAKETTRAVRESYISSLVARTIKRAQDLQEFADELAFAGQRLESEASQILETHEMIVNALDQEAVGA